MNSFVSCKQLLSAHGVIKDNPESNIYIYLENPSSGKYFIEVLSLFHFSLNCKDPPCSYFVPYVMVL